MKFNMPRDNTGLAAKPYCSAVIKLQSKLKFVNAMESNFTMRFIDVSWLAHKL